ncbi:insulin receptor-like [Ostrinia furnacalis]|uniref:insulin receptor-like n=1 Tax=Ostrinia furnacalis TaxID=93504 RepID=UPI0010404BCE|nr:insulin receptor-like [Ostrinia furnacalis]XP_028165922.1 insulin receptor-like [Ostrinia furnacalis]
MEATKTVILLCAIFLGCSAQRLDSEPTNATGKICGDVHCTRPDRLERMLKDCMVILGNLKIVIMEQAHKDDFVNISFPKLREVTGYVAFYRVNGLESIGQLFPNLTRIRGEQLFYNYALIIFDIPDLKEVGLYNLLKVDRGGVIIWTVPQACFINTINWNLIAPRTRHVLSPVWDSPQCNTACSCTRNASTNYCWNILKCQRLPEDINSNCNKQCLGCRLSNPNECTICRHYTYKNRCVPKCPAGTIVLPHNDYCITEEECKDLRGWSWNNTCVFNCTVGYKMDIKDKDTVCVPCEKCEETCGSLNIQTIESIQESGRCVYVNGSLVIRIRSHPEAMEELRTYLSRIQEVSDFIIVYGSLKITSLDFLSSLKRIGGRNLKNGTHSLIIYDMTNLQTLFTENVTNTLQVEKGSLYIYNNPMLCVNEIDKIKSRFPDKPGPLDIPSGTNGYSGGCANASIGLQLNVINETSISVDFTHVANPQAHYSILYIHLPQGSRKVFVPETCSDSEWHAYNIPHDLDSNTNVVLRNLRPASTYALCIEKYDPKTKILARSDIFNFTTPVGKPEPPFILELVASSSDVVVVRWVDHKVYRSHIKRYELDVTLIEIYPKDVSARDHCKKKRDSLRIEEEIDYFRHAVVMRPPPDYDRGCESMCGVLSTVTAGAMVEEYFDVCSSIEDGCNNLEVEPPKNSSFGNFVRTLTLNISGPRNDFQIAGLAPFRDYKFRLRACSADKCSRYARGVVRTLRSEYADKPVINYVTASESGEIRVEWDPPKVTNGPVLAYTVKVLPSVKYDEPGHLQSQTWCLSSDKRHFVVKYIKAKKYLISVCSTTLASRSVCSDRKRVIMTTNLELRWCWTGVIIGILIYISTLVVGILWKKQNDYSYEMPLLENMVIADSEPPSTMMSDFMPVYTIPLRDTRLD